MKSARPTNNLSRVQMPIASQWKNDKGDSGESVGNRPLREDSCEFRPLIFICRYEAGIACLEN